MAVNATSGEATVTSKGQITVPNDLRKALGIRWRPAAVRADKGRFVRLEARSAAALSISPRQRILRRGSRLDLDKTIDEAITLAMEERDRRSRGG